MVKGVVKDEQGLPLFHVAVFVPGTNLGTHTNENGEYQINLKPGNYALNFNFIGYETVVKNLKIGQEKFLPIDVDRKSTRLNSSHSSVSRMPSSA